jgi:hypothetical protein
MQLAARVGNSARSRMLVQRQAGLQQFAPRQLSGRDQPVIQRKSDPN